METKKKKIVAKVIAKNVLVWICTLCLVLCFIPLRSKAADEPDVAAAVDEVAEGEGVENSSEELGEEEEADDEDSSTADDEEKDAEGDSDLDGDTDDDADDGDDSKSDSGEEEEPTEHEHPLTLGCDATGHWQYCEEEDCEFYWDGLGEISDKIKEVYFEAHDLELEEEVPPTCDTLGIGKYTCSVCGYKFEEEVNIPTKHTPPSEEDEFTTDEHSHTYRCEVCKEEVTEEHAWFKGQEGDTFICQVCGAKHTEQEHDWEDVITKAPTFKIEGEMYSQCKICGVRTDSKPIPTINERGISWGVADANTGLKPSLQTNGDVLVEYLLTDEEKARVANENLEVQFMLEVSEEDVSKFDKDLVKAYMDINAKLNGYHVLKYVDINLYKQIGEDPREEIHETGTMISFSVELPDAVQEAGRSYAVIRVHEGQPYTIETPETKGTLMVSTDKFSTYAIVYNGAAIDGTGNGNTGNGNNTGNGSNTGNNGNGQNSGNGNNNNGNTGNGGNNSASGSTSDTNNGSTGNQGNATTATDSNDGNANNNNAGNASPKTADSSPIVLYMTIAMISAMAYLFLFVTDKERRMTEQDKDVLIRELTLWARKHGATAKFFMAFAVFCILLYYHTVGKRVKGVVKEQA